MPSSFCNSHSSTLGFSPHLPVSVYGTDTRMAPRGTFLGSMIRTSWLAFRLVSLSRLGLDPIFQRDHIPTRFDRHFRSPAGRSLLRIPVSTPPKWCRNIDLLSIGYAFRPHLRVRLTLSGLTFLRKPWVFGGRVSRPSSRYSFRHNHFCFVQPTLPVDLHPTAERSPTRRPYGRIHSFGGGLQSRTLSAQDPLTSELLRTL